MFTILSAYGITKDTDAQWKNHDVVNLTPAQINATFRKLYLTLQGEGQSGSINVDISSLSLQLDWQEDTLAAIFANWGNQAFTPVELPNYRAERVIFGEAFRLGYEVNRAKPGSHYSSTGLPTEKTELQIYRSDIDMERFSRQCVMMANGYLYRHEYSNGIVYVPGAGYSLAAGDKRNNVGFLSFEKIGDVSQIPITEAMVRKASPSTKLADKCLIQIPQEVDTNGKTIMLVLAGHLYFMGDVVRQTADRLLRIRMEVVPVMERFIESRGCIDYSGLGLDDHLGDRFDLEEFFSDDVMRKYIAHPQSFLLVVDTPRISYSLQYIKNLPLPGRFISRKEPTAPLRVSHNRFAEYWSVEDGGEWLICVADAWQGNRQYTHVPYSASGTAGPTNTPYQTYYDSRAHFLDIVADVDQNP